MQQTITHEPPRARYSRERLEGNLAVLRRVDPELVERLSLPVAGQHVVFDDRGELHYVAHRNPCSLSLGADPEGLGAPEVLLFGIGEGDIVDRALARASSQRVLAWERDPWLLRLELMRADRREALSSGRLRYVLGPDVLDLRPFEGAVVPHPVLGSAYGLELDSFRNRRRTRRALMCVGKLFYEQVAHELRARGYEVWSLDVVRHAEEELSRSVRRFAPELVVSINYTAGLAEFCHAHGKKLVVWEVDPSVSGIAEVQCPADDVWIWTYRKQNIERYRQAGFRNVSYLPLAADPLVRAPSELDARALERYDSSVSFVGNSLVPASGSFRARFLDRFAEWRGTAPGEDDEGDRLLAKLMEIQRSDWTRFSIPGALDERVPGFREELLRGPQPVDVGVLAGELAGAEKRLTYVANLASLGIRVWGDDGWSELAEQGVAYQGPATHGQELTDIYCSSAINLDINRIYQDDIITMRVFDVLSAGGFVLAEHSAALADAFLVGQEVVSYDGLEDLKVKAKYFLEHGEEAREIVRRGRDRVLHDHTIERRVRWMLEAL